MDPNFLDQSEPVVRGPDAISDSRILPDIVPNNHSVMLKPDYVEDCWHFNCKKFLIRPEYKEAERFILSTFHSERVVSGLVIAGQSDTGSPLFCSAMAGP